VLRRNASVCFRANALTRKFNAILHSEQLSHHAHVNPGRRCAAHVNAERPSGAQAVIGLIDMLRQPCVPALLKTRANHALMASQSPEP
jgi:hypothetical protein